MTEQLYKHKKTGGLYIITGKAMMQCNKNYLYEGSVIVYKNAMTEEFFVRPSDEFFDGRFEIL